MMKELLEGSVYFGVLISLGSYAIGMYLRRRTGCSFVNPLLVSRQACKCVHRRL